MKFGIGLIQLESVLGDTVRNLKKAEGCIREAAARGAKIACLPETFLTGYNLGILGDRMNSLAEEPDGYSVEFLCSLAKELGIYLIAPMAMKLKGDSRLNNAAVFIRDDGCVAGTYNKNHVFGGMDGEGRYFATHGDYPVYDTPYGRIGILICYDMNFPEPARILALKGAQLLFVPSAWRVQDIDLWHLLTLARANENTVYLAAVNAWQESDNLHLFGQSKIVNPRGQLVAQANEKGSVVLVHEIDLDTVEGYRQEMPFLSHRNPGTYGFINECVNDF